MKVTNVTLDELWPVMEEQIKAGKTVIFAPKGVSMLPMLRQGIDKVELTQAPSRLQKYDVPLYRRKNGQFVLHRIIDISPDGSYVMCGDNQVGREHNITDDMILCVMKGFYRGDTYVSCDDPKYISYAKKRVRTQHRKWLLLKVKNKLLRIFRLRKDDQN